MIRCKPAGGVCALSPKEVGEAGTLADHHPTNRVICTRAPPSLPLSIIGQGTQVCPKESGTLGHDLTLFVVRIEGWRVASKRDWLDLRQAGAACHP